MEKSTGTVLYEKNAHERLSPASVTKVMTMLLAVEAIEAGRITGEEVVTASARAASMGGSQIWLKDGEKATITQIPTGTEYTIAEDETVLAAYEYCNLHGLWKAEIKSST